MFHIVEINLYVSGNNIRLRYLGKISRIGLWNHVEAVGKELCVKCSARKCQYVYTDIPKITYSGDDIHILDKSKMVPVLEAIYSYIKDNRMYIANDTYFIQNIDLLDIVPQYVDAITLMNGVTPLQSSYRALLDINDQLFPALPKIMCTFVMEVRDSEIQEHFYIWNIQLESDMEFSNINTTSESFIVFRNGAGHFIYDLLSGYIGFKLSSTSENELKTLLQNNYPNSIINKIAIHILAIVVDANYRTLILN